MAKILLVDDDDDMATIVIDALTENGHSVKHMSDGNDAWEELGLRFYDLLILDWNLPGLSGHAVLQKYRRIGGRTPIMVTGMSSIENKVMGLEAGADDYVSKPFALPDLVIRVRSLLRRINHVYGQSVAAAQSVTY